MLPVVLAAFVVVGAMFVWYAALAARAVRDVFRALIALRDRALPLVEQLSADGMRLAERASKLAVRSR